MTRRSARYRAQLSTTLSLADGDSVACRTRDVSDAGVFLEVDLGLVDVVPGATVHVAMMDAAAGEVVEVRGQVVRCVERSGGQLGGVAVRLDEAPASWAGLVARLGAQGRALTGDPVRRRLRILVVGDDARRRGAMALYVTSGWDVRFAGDLATMKEALSGFRIDAIVAEHDLDDPRWPRLLEEVKKQQPMAKRLVRAPLKGGVAPPRGAADDLVHQVVDLDAGLDAFVAAITD